MGNKHLFLADEDLSCKVREDYEEENKILFNFVKDDIKESDKNFISFYCDDNNSLSDKSINNVLKISEVNG